MKPLNISVAAMLLSGAVVLASPFAAQAETLNSEDRTHGQWGSTALEMDKLAQIATGKGVKIAVIDAAINPNVPELKGANIKVMESTCLDIETGEPFDPVSDDPWLAAHGTNDVAMLVGNGVAGDGGPGTRGIVPDAEIWFYGIGYAAQASDELAERGLDTVYWDRCIPNDPLQEKGGKGLLWDTEAAYNLTIGIGSPLAMNDDEGELIFDEVGVEGRPTSLVDEVALAARAAIRDGADIVTTSIDSGASAGWSQVIIEANAAGVPVFGGTDNPSDSLFEGSLTKSYQTNGYFAINMRDENNEMVYGGYVWPASGWTNLFGTMPGTNLLGVGDRNGSWGPTLIHGTSYATPLAAGAVALGLEAHPDATAFQITQSLMHTAGEVDQPVAVPVWREKWQGFGALNPLLMLHDEPTRYPDENPVFVDDPASDLCLEPEERGKGLTSPATLDDRGWLIDCEWALSPTTASAEYEKSRETHYGPVRGAVVPRTESWSEAEPPAITVRSYLIIAAIVVGVFLAIAAGVLIVLRRLHARRLPALFVAGLVNGNRADVVFDEALNPLVRLNGEVVAHLSIPNMPLPADPGSIWLNPEAPRDVVGALVAQGKLVPNPSPRLDGAGVAYSQARVQPAYLAVSKRAAAYHRRQQRSRTRTRQGPPPVAQQGPQPGTQSPAEPTEEHTP